MRRFAPLLALVLASPLWAQVVDVGGGDAVSPDEAKLQARILSIQPAEAKMGDTVIVKVELELPRGWHVYGLVKGTSGVPTAFKVEKGPFRVGAGVKEPTPKEHREVYGNGVEEKYPYHEGKVVFEVPLEVTGEAKPGETKIVLAVHYMLCTMALCLDETDINVETSLKILEGGVAKPPTVATPGNSAPPPAKEKGSLLRFLLLAVTTGLVTLITPCVFPMIPVTISFFTKQASGGRGGTVVLAATYGIGIIVSYTAIGLIVSALLGATGAQTFSGNAWVNLAICAIFVVFAFSLFGWFELVLPGSVTNSMSASGKSGIIGALLLGLTFSITAFTCAAPFAGTLLGLAVQGEKSWAFLGFFTYSATMAIPFFFLGLFPTALKKMPKSGGWLNSVKVVMGFVELAAACKFLANVDSAWQWNIVSRSGVLAFWTACAAASTMYLLGWFRFEHDEPVEHVSVPRMLWAVVFLSLGIFTASGLAGRHLGIVEAYLPLPEEKLWIGEHGGGNGTPAEKELDSYSAALAAGKEKRRPIFLEFTAFN